MSTISHSSAPWNAPPPTYDGYSSSYMTTTLTPYLQLPHLLSLTWLAYPILSLLFVAFRLQLSLAASQDAVVNAKDDLLASCRAAEQSATSAASMPRFMALATNEQFVDAVNGTLRGARAALVLSLTVMEAIINFIVDLYRSTLLCFLELVVRGGLAILIGAVQEVNNLLQSAASGLRTGIQNDIQSANSVIQSAIDSINKINPFSDITAPQITVPSLDGLQNIQIPSSFQDSLTNLNSSLPTFQDLKDKVEAIIDTPFELVKKEINDTFASISFNSSVLPVPEQNRISFCNDMDLSVVDDIGRDLIKTAKIGIVILIALALVLIGLNCLFTWYKWRSMKSHLEYIREAWRTDPTMCHTKTATGPPQMTLTDHHLLVLQADMSHPLATRITNQLSRLLRLTPSQHTHLLWFFHYIFHPPAVAVFLIGFFGLLCVQLQLLAMGPLVAKYQDRAASTVSDFSNTIATSINASMYNQSSVYANDVNSRVDAMQTTLNNGLFGWVNTTTVTLNSTINEFYTDVENAVNTVFGGTILEQPAQEFLRCFIGSKVDAIENALTFLHDNLKVDMPRMNQSVLVLSPESVNEAASPIAAAAIGGGDNDEQGLIGRLVNTYADSLKKERIMFAIFLALWGIVVLMGIAVVLWHSYGHPWLENRKRKRYLNQRNVDISDVIVPFRGPGNANGGEAPPAWAARSSSDPINNLALSVPPYVDEKAWNDHLGENKSRQPIEQRKGFIAAAKERLVPRKAPPPFIPEGRRQTAWLGKMATFLNKKGQQESAEEHNLNQVRASDDETVERSIGGQGGEAHQEIAVHAPKSRWSTSPDVRRSAPWSGILSPSKKSVVLPSANPISPVKSLPSSSSGNPRISLPRPLQPKHLGQSNVSMDIVTSTDDVKFSQGDPAQSQWQQSAVPLPLHHGSAVDRFEYLPPSKSTRYSRGLASSTHSLHSPQPSSIQRHWRSVSVPEATENIAGVGAGIKTIATPATRMLTASHPQEARNDINSLISPFDDEHKVTIDQPARTRKSIPTNPFEPVAL